VKRKSWNVPYVAVDGVDGLRQETQQGPQAGARLSERWRAWKIWQKVNGHDHDLRPSEPDEQ
jgi:hypothetical protein